MILELDRGNTQLKWRLCTDAGAALPAPAGTPHDGAMGFVRVQEDPALQTLRKAVEAAGAECGEPLRRVRMVNVAGAVEERRIAYWCRKRWKIEPQAVHPTAEAAGVRNAYAEAEALGADRWLAILAAHQLHPDTGACVADCGSALTVDFVTAGGEHLGGYIAPGVEILSSALENALVEVGEGPEEPLPILGSYLVEAQASATGGEEAPAEEVRDTAPGRSTGAGLRAAAPLMMAGLVELAYRECVKQRPELSEAPILLTGGDRRTLLPHLTIARVEEHPTLVLDGLRLVAP